VRIEPKTLA